MFDFIKKDETNYGVVRADLKSPAYDDFTDDMKSIGDTIGNVATISDSSGRKRVMYMTNNTGSGFTINDRYYNPDGSLVGSKMSNSFEGNIFHVGMQYSSDKTIKMEEVIATDMYKAQDFLIQNGFGELTSPENDTKIAQMMQNIETNPTPELVKAKESTKYDIMKNTAKKMDDAQEDNSAALQPIL